jgi:hypothetical protein
MPTKRKFPHPPHSPVVKGSGKGPKPPRSPIEKDPNKPLIERALAMGIPMTQVARRYGYGTVAIKRFRDRMPQQLKAAIVAAALKPKEADLDKLRIEESEGLLGNLAHQRARLLHCQDQLIESGGFSQVAYLSTVIHKNLEMVGRYVGLFGQHHVSTNVNILISEDYLRLRQALTLALRPFPEARRAVAEELHRIEGQVAQRMMDQHHAAAQAAQDARRGSPGAVIDQLPMRPAASASAPQASSNGRTGPVITS